MKTQNNTSLPNAGLPLPEIVCSCCSGRLEFESFKPAEVIPCTYKLKCHDCNQIEEVFFHQKNEMEN